MKTFTKFLTMLAVAALFATGCVNEEPPYKEDPNPEPAGTTGYLSIGNLSMTVVYDETEIRPDDTSDETQAARTASGTRATAPDVDSFIVEILDADNAQVLEMTYAQLKEQLKTPMELKVGAYRMEVRSEDTMPGVDWEHPVYGATSDFTITKAQTTSPEAVLTLAVDKSSGQTGPRITWRGYDIDQQYEVQKDMVIDIDIEADKGIKSFFVTIDSETLRPLLPVINLPEKFDICDIPDELVEVLHGEFGFPINEQVKNRTSVTFSITKFVEILLKIPGEHNFVLDVTDNDNVLTHKTVKLIVH